MARPDGRRHIAPVRPAFPPLGAGRTTFFAIDVSVSGTVRRAMGRIPQSRAVATARIVLARLELSSRTGIDPEPFARTLFLGMPAAPSRRAVADTTFRCEVWQALDGMCGLCGYPIVRLSEVTFDHVVPRAKGGGEYANLLPAHSPCNNAKADRMPTACETIMLDAVNLRMGNRVPGICYSLGKQRVTLADCLTP